RIAGNSRSIPLTGSQSLRRPRFSIASLLVVIGILGVALAALRNPSYLWANVTFTMAFASLVLAIVNPISGRAARRAYWLGFPVSGGAYFAVCSLPGLRDSVCPRLATEVIFDLLYPNMAPPIPPAPSQVIFDLLYPNMAPPIPPAPSQPPVMTGVG